MVHISRVSIKNFRSIKSAEFTANYLNVFVGQNDAGKSNILRALNLFFNGVTSPGAEYNFNLDHCSENNPNKKAKRIEVEIEIDLPGNYIKNNGDKIVWKKTWRDFGEESEDYYGVRLETGKRGKEYREKVKISQSSNVHSLLRQIEFIYVPAVRDPSYFQELRREIYRLISETASHTFKESSKDFESSIAQHLQGLSDEIFKFIGTNTNLVLPGDLSNIFERLDFVAEQGDRRISLNSRGDGIKASHIPVILKFISDKKKALQTKGRAPFTYIWGYEEPENNVEMSRCFPIAEEFYSYMYDFGLQVFITTHSPVFYNLVNKNTDEESYVSSFHVALNDRADGSQVLDEVDDLDDTMGITRLVAPYLKDAERRWREKNALSSEIDVFVAEGVTPVFLEGETDKAVLQVACEVFAPELLAKVRFVTGKRAGVEYVKNKLAAWESYMRNEQNRRKAFGIFDGDIAGVDAIKFLDKSKKSKKRRYIDYVALSEFSSNYIFSQKEGMTYSVVLESLYDESVWDYAKNEGWLQKVSVLGLISEQHFEKMIEKGIGLSDVLKENYHLSFEYVVAPEFKSEMARYACAGDNLDLKLKNFEPIVNHLSLFKA